MMSSPQRYRDQAPDGYVADTDFNAKALTHGLFTGRLGGQVYFFESIDSTNRIAFQLAIDGAIEGTLVIADAQTHGKGRLNRIWISPAGCNLYISMVFRPDIHPEAAPQLSILAGAAVAETLKAYIASGVSLKWPNDVLVGGKKICGILTELRSHAGKVDFIVVGIGLNVNMLATQFDPNLRQTATSLFIELGQHISRKDVLTKLIANLEHCYGVYRCEGFEAIRKSWLRNAGGIGEQVRVSFQDDSIEGKWGGLDEDGALLLKDDSGGVKRIMAGEITFLGRINKK
jgi:BirA family biotin operon repressor/biotin-[acetyl-CoA-carboxylase] ligase